jgi:hypothetical protein
MEMKNLVWEVSSWFDYEGMLFSHLFSTRGKAIAWAKTHMERDLEEDEEISDHWDEGYQSWDSTNWTKFGSLNLRVRSREVK